MVFIDLRSSTYSDLSQFAILASGALTSTGIITVSSGYWYGSPVTGTPFNTAGFPSGLNNSITSSFALNQLDTLITEIGTVTSSLPTTIDIGAGGSDYTFLPNINYIGTGITYTGKTITFDAQGDTNAQFFITDNGTGFTFTSTAFVLANSARRCNIFWLANNGATGAFTSTNSSVPGIIITSADFTITNDAAPSINTNGHIYSKGAATLTRSGTGALTAVSSNCAFRPNPGPEPVVCYAKGTLILTKQGFVPIETIKAGDKVVTNGKIHKNKYLENTPNMKIEPVVWISKFKVNHLNSKSRPICIKENALGKNCPFKDLYVSPGHSLLLDGKMVLAKNMVNETTIYQDNECDNVEYYHLECQHHAAIFANGVLAESYLDVNNRHVFENSIRRACKVETKPRSLKMV